MIVTAALIWWNELPEDLERCVRGMATIADRLVAVDGAYARYPGAGEPSDMKQWDAIDDTAHSVGLSPHGLFGKDRVWAGQVEKRSFALSTAARGSDWVAVFDSDWIASGDRKAARKELASFDDSIDVVSVPFYTPPSENKPATGWHEAVSDTQVQMPHLFRALPEMGVERYHWYVGARKGKEKVWMWGPRNEERRLLTPHDLEAPYQIEHRTLHRTEEQVRASRAFLNDRVLVVGWTGQEDDRPDLPRPEFDYETVPHLAAQRQASRKMSARERHRLRRLGL
jgi:hypothetical protein